MVLSGNGSLPGQHKLYLLRRSFMAIVQEFLKANEAYASTFHKGELAMPPARHVAVLVRMDARIDPARALGLEEGDAHVIRNAGGRAADALRLLVLSDQLLGTTEILTIHHTDCRMLPSSIDHPHNTAKK